MIGPLRSEHPTTRAKSAGAVHDNRRALKFPSSPARAANPETPKISCGSLHWSNTGSAGRTRLQVVVAAGRRNGRRAGHSVSRGLFSPPGNVCSMSRARTLRCRRSGNQSGAPSRARRMLCFRRAELANLGKSHDGIMELRPTRDRRRYRALAWPGLGDPVFEINLTAKKNRPEIVSTGVATAIAPRNLSAPTWVKFFKRTRLCRYKSAQGPEFPCPVKK